MKKSKLTTYLLYAIGEIVLVVIGILIAVAINDQNQEWKDRKLERKILTQIREDLEQSKADIEGDLGLLRMGNTSFTLLLEYIEKDYPYHDSLTFEFHFLIRDQNTVLQRAGWDQLNESGLHIMTNDTIKLELKMLYSGIKERLDIQSSFYPQLSDFFNDYYLQHFYPNNDLTIEKTLVLGEDTTELPLPDDTGKLAYQRTLGYTPIDFEALKKDPTFKMLLIRSREFRSHKMRWYRVADQSIETLILRIDQELNR